MPEFMKPVFLSEAIEYYEFAKEVMEMIRLNHCSHWQNELSCCIRVSFYEKDGGSCSIVAVIDADGSLWALYRMTHYYGRSLL